MQTLPSSWRITDGAFNETTAYVRTQFAAGTTRPADVAEPPRRRFVSLPAGTTAVDLHARFDAGRIFISVAIAGRTFYFLLDSGASAITIDPGVAKQFGLVLVNESHEIAGQRYETHDTIIPAMNVGGLRWMHDVAAIGAVPRDGP